jgi:hypothetical protein
LAKMLSYRADGMLNGGDLGFVAPLQCHLRS